MQYSEEDVLSIIKSCGKKNPKEVLSDWSMQKANTKLPNPESYDQFIYSFDWIVEDKKVATITLADMFSHRENESLLIHKYLGEKESKKTMSGLSEDSFLYCYLTIHKAFKLPELCDGLYGATFKANDAGGKEFSFQACYGSPTNQDELVYYLGTNYGIFRKNSYYFPNSDLFIKIDTNPEGWQLGPRINHNIKERTKKLKSKQKLKTAV